MKTAVLSAAVLGLLLATSAFANQHHGQPGDQQASHHQQGDVHHPEHGRPSPPQHGRPQAHGPEQHPHHEAQGAVHHGPEHPSHPGYATTGRPSEMHSHGPTPHPVRRDIWQRQRAQHWQREHRTWHERGGYHGYRIPEDRFHAYFGRGHWFRVHNVPVMVVEGYPRFQYAGFWFTLVDPWPETWSATWYTTDDVYIDYVNDGYYMYNRRHPGIAIAINVSL